MKKIKETVLSWIARMPTQNLEAMVERLVREHAARISPKSALRFLFRLDAFLYVLEGQKAIEYGGGLHSKHRHTRYHDFFVERIGPEDRVLDVGCGIGVMAQKVAEKTGARVVAIDINEQSIAQAKKRFGHPRVDYRVGDAQVDVLGGPFDVVVLSNVLEHLTDRTVFLNRLVVSAQPDRLLIRVPLFERDWRVPLKSELGVEWRLDPTHEVEYTMESFCEEMEAAGLMVASREVRWGEIWAECRSKR